MHLYISAELTVHIFKHKNLKGYTAPIKVTQRKRRMDYEPAGFVKRVRLRSYSGQYSYLNKIWKKKKWGYYVERVKFKNEQKKRDMSRV